VCPVAMGLADRVNRPQYLMAKIMIMMMMMVVMMMMMMIIIIIIIIINYLKKN
jgi:hypothetical protein